MTDRPFVLMSDAFEVVHEAAHSGMLGSREASGILELEAEAVRQQEAVDVFGDFIGNYFEEIDTLQAGLYDVVPSADLDILRAMSTAAHPLHQSLLVALELACQTCGENHLPTSRLSASIDQVTSFWFENGEEICGATVSLSVFSEADGPTV